VLNAFGAGTLTLNGGQLNLRAVGSGGSKTIATGNNVVIGSSAVTIDVNRPSGSNTGNVFAMGSLTLGSGQLNVTGGNTYSLRFDGPVTLVDNATVNPTTANLSFPTTATISESGGSFGITKLGAGSLTLNAANSFSGQVSIIEGSVTTNNSAAFGTASVIQLGGNAGGNQNAQLYTNDFTISRPIVVQGNNTGAVTIGSQSTSTNTSTYSGNITLGSGGIRHDAAIVTGDFHTVVLSGTISGLGGLSTKTGTSTSRVVLNANNSYSGGTLIQGATRAENNNALGTGTVTLAAGTLGTQVNNITISNGQMWTGNFNGGFDTSGNGKALTTAGANTIAGGDRILSMPGASLTINGGITDDANSYSLTIRSSASDGTNSFLALNGANSFDGGLIIVGPNATRTLTVSTGNAGALGSGLATLTNSAGSVLRLTTSISTEGLTSGMATPSFTAGSGMTNNTYTLNVTGGGGTGAAGTAVVSGGSITSVSITSYGRNYTSAPTISLTGAGGTGTITTAFVASIVNLQGNALTITSSGSNTATYAGALTGTGGSLVKSNTGTQVLTGTNLYTGATKINGGNLTIGLAGSINGTSGITISGAGATLQYDSSVALSKAVSFGAGGGSFIYNEGATGYTGNFALGTGQLVGGSGKINGSIDSSGGGTISPGSGPGILTIGGNVTVGSGHFAVELGKSGASPVAGTDYDRLSLTAANATINLSGGDLVLDIGNNVGDLDLYFIVSNANTGGGSTGTSGTFATLNGQVVAGLDGSQNFFLGDHEFAISYTADVTGGTGGTFTGGNDVAIMAVPEPAGLGLLGAGAFGLLTRRRRRR
jgi:autotransporter-associated beta strand protein